MLQHSELHQLSANNVQQSMLHYAAVFFLKLRIFVQFVFEIHKTQTRDNLFHLRHETIETSERKKKV
ncbi:hypothetical protein BpHYR1_025239 [Brachionus plicatilis]|uniref:Uncharacterized protein n=1 Tax=Brachionus plicatilis TaxID=10195 RepID=A0A3M7TAQ5_BRAPC|nr:hypothetical protein BpHYR1_025239 [Brachionus plicatilis]